MDSRGSVRSGVVCFGCCVAKGVEAACVLRLFVGGGRAGAFWREEEEGAGEKTNIEGILATMILLINTHTRARKDQ